MKTETIATGPIFSRAPIVTMPVRGERVRIYPGQPAPEGRDVLFQAPPVEGLFQSAEGISRSPAAKRRKRPDTIVFNLKTFEGPMQVTVPASPDYLRGVYVVEHIQA